MKAASAGFIAHLDREVTAFKTLTRITRRDGTVFTFTDHDKDITLDPDGGPNDQTFLSAGGYTRSSIINTASLSVDNLDISSHLDPDFTSITESHIRAGLFDFAEVEMWMVVFLDLSLGVVPLRRGYLGELSLKDETYFAEFRGLVQALTQSIVEITSPQCRADLGDDRCGVNLTPDVVSRSTAYEVGDLVRASALLEGIVVPTLLVPADTDANDISPNLFTGTLNGDASIVSTQSKFGGSSVEFTGSATGGVSYVDDPAFTIGANDFTIDLWVRPDTIALWGFASHYNNIGGQRAWWLGMNSTVLNLFLGDDGSSALPAISINPAFTFVADTWYHVAVTRDSNKVVRLYVDGVQINGSYTDTISVGSATTFTRTVGSWIDDGIIAGATIVTSGFTDPANNGSFTVSGAPTATTLTVSSATLVPEAGTGDEVVNQTVPFAIFNSNEVFRLGFVNSTTDILFDGWIDDFRFVNGTAVWTDTSFTPPSVAHTPGVTQALLDSLVTADFDDVYYRCTTAGTTSGAQPAFDPTVGNDTTDGTAVFTAEEAWVRAGTVATVGSNKLFTAYITESRAIDDWFNHGAVQWDTGNNAIVPPMDVTDWLGSVTTGITTMGVTDSNTFNRSAGSFVGDGFVAGMRIDTTGFTDSANNGTFTVVNVAALTLDIVETTLVAESGTADELMTSIGEVTLFLGMPFEIQVGDTFSIYRGCRKDLVDCTVFDAVLNYRGEPYLPGTDALMRDPKSADAAPPDGLGGSLFTGPVS